MERNVSPFPNRATLDALLKQSQDLISVAKTDEDPEARLAEIDQHFEVINQHKDLHPIDYYRDIEDILELVDSDKIEEYSHIVEAINMLLGDNHPAFALRKKQILEKLRIIEAPEETTPLKNLPPRQVLDIIDEIHSRELPPLDGSEDIHPEVAFLELWDEVPEGEFYRILFAYCDSWGIPYLLQ